MPLGMIEVDKLKKDIMQVCEKTLDYCEVMVPSAEQYKILRKKLLRYYNDLCRKVDLLGGNGKALKIAPDWTKDKEE